MPRARRVVITLLAAITLASACTRESSQPPTQAASADTAAPDSVTHITSDIWLLSAAGGNMVVLLGKDSSLVVGAQLPSVVARARQLVVEHQAGPVRLVVAAPADSAPAYGDGGWSATDALVLTHESLRSRMNRVRHPRDGDAPAAAAHSALPAIGFSDVVQLYLDGQSVHAIHHHAGYSDADLIVHFENANVVYLGNTFTTDGYPSLRLDRGGSIAAMIEAIQSFDGFPDGTHFVPGHGAAATKRDLVAYGEMLIGVRDRVRRLIDAGRSEQEAVAAKPTAAFDARWGTGPVTPDAFVRMVYESLTQH
jgi:hypothetical protein